MKLIAFLFLTYSFGFALILDDQAPIIEPKDVNQCHARDIYKNSKLNKKQCNELFFKINQIFYFSFDDVDALNGNLAHQMYLDYFKLNNPTGIILTFSQAKSPTSVRKQLKNLVDRSSSPLFIGGDDCHGYINNQRYRIVVNTWENSCQSNINAAMVKIFGCNTLFGPRIEKSINQKNINNFDDEIINKAKRDISILKKYGIISTLKHFPFVPDTIDLHKATENILIPEEKLNNTVLIPFNKMLPHNGLIMTTHIFSTLVDQKNLVTFSKSWINILKNSLNTKGNLIITDSLDMINYYSPIDFQSGFPFKVNYKIQAEGYFAIRALLAGHDLLMTRRSLRFQEYAVIELHRAAMKNNELGELLRDQINLSYNNVMTFKKTNSQYLNYFPEISDHTEKIIFEAYLKMKDIKDNDCLNPKLSEALKSLEFKN